MFSSIAADHVRNRRNCGPIEGATHFGHCGERGEGPYVEIWLEMQAENHIVRAAYRTHGCPSSIASASVLCQVLTGGPVARAKLIDSRDLLLILGGLPEGKEQFADMAINALHDALSNAKTITVQT